MKLILEKYSEQIKFLKDLHDRHHKYIPAIFFTLGFTLDVLTLGEVDDLSNIFILGFYLLICGSILIIEYMELETFEFKNKWANKIFHYRSDVFNFLLGALLSAFTLFYFKSGSLANSFIFMFFMTTLLILNEMEFFQKKSTMVRSSMVMLCLISYLIYIVPIIIGKSGAFIFFSCILLSILISLLSFILLNKFIKKNEQAKNKTLMEQLIPS